MPETLRLFGFVLTVLISILHLLMLVLWLWLRSRSVAPDSRAMPLPRFLVWNLSGTVLLALSMYLQRIGVATDLTFALSLPAGILITLGLIGSIKQARSSLRSAGAEEP